MWVQRPQLTPEEAGCCGHHDSLSLGQTQASVSCTDWTWDTGQPQVLDTSTGGSSFLWASCRCYRMGSAVGASPETYPFPAGTWEVVPFGLSNSLCLAQPGLGVWWTACIPSLTPLPGQGPSKRWSGLGVEAEGRSPQPQKGSSWGLVGNTAGASDTGVPGLGTLSGEALCARPFLHLGVPPVVRRQAALGIPCAASERPPLEAAPEMEENGASNFQAEKPEASGCLQMLLLSLALSLF